MTYNKNLAWGINCDDEPVYKCNKCKEELELDDDNIDTLEEVKN
jgi:DNA-directed RNA polymerase subunit RPC12/RpoP